MSRKGVIFLCTAIRAVYVQQSLRIHYRRYSSTPSDGSSEKEHLRKLASFADALSHSVLDADDSADEENKRTSQAAVLPRFEDVVSKQAAKKNKKEAIAITKQSNEGDTRRRLKWSKEEEEELIRLAESSRVTGSSQINWNEVTKVLGHRTLFACRLRYAILVRKQMGKAEDDFQLSPYEKERSFASPRDTKAIEEGIRLYGEHSWTNVAAHAKKVTGVHRPISSIMRIWYLGLCPKVRKAPMWTKTKTDKLKKLVKIHGNDPVFLSIKFFPEYPPQYLTHVIKRLGTIRDHSDPRLAYVQSSNFILEPNKPKTDK
ncbi:hypothetical protein EV175_004852 [Coemansia sp. RSA 1933]|nr:hypothetical protein EV175_004852 [Coemansia sp. RSA 1933]